MVNDFLKKYQEELFSEKIQLKEDIDLLETKIKEENKFLALLEESNESYFKEFTPRDINAKNNKKAEEIRNYLSELTNELDVKNNKMKFYDSRLVEINALLTNTAVENKPEKINYGSGDFIENSEVADLKQNIYDANLVDSLFEIRNLILLDPYRAQIELDKIISQL